MNLYQVQNNLIMLADEIAAVQNDPDLSEQQKEVAITNLKSELLQNRGRKQDRLLELAKHVKNLVAEKKAIKDEMSRLRGNANVLKNKIFRIKEFIGSFLDPDDKIKDPQAQISFRTSHRLQIDINAEIPNQYKKYPKWKPNKRKLKKDIKAGKVIPDIYIKDFHNLQIK